MQTDGRNNVVRPFKSVTLISPTDYGTLGRMPIIHHDIQQYQVILLVEFLPSERQARTAVSLGGGSVSSVPRKPNT